MTRKKFSEGAKEGLSCLVMLIIVAIIITVFALLLRYWDKKDAENHRIYVEMAGKGDSCLQHSDLKEAVRYYTKAFEAQEVDTLAVTLFNCELALGNVDAGLTWLDKYADMTFRSGFVELRRTWAQFAKDGDTTQMISSLDAMIRKPLTLESPSAIRRLWDTFWNDDSDYTMKNNYTLYYSDYYAKLTALYYRLGACKTEEEFREISEYIFKLAEDQEDDHAYIDEFTKLGGKSDISSDIYAHEARLMNTTDELRWQSMQHRTYIMKWWMFNLAVTDMHVKHGYRAAVDYANSLTGNNALNADSNHSYHKCLYGIYLGASDPAKFPTTLTVDELDTILAYSMDHNGMIPSATYTVVTGGQNVIGKRIYTLEQFREDGDVITEPIIVLACGRNHAETWNWKMSGPPVILSDSSTSVSYINNQFKASESTIKPVLLGAKTYQIPSTLYVLNLLQAEYSKQKGLSPYESIVDLKKLMTETTMQ